MKEKRKKKAPEHKQREKDEWLMMVDPLGSYTGEPAEDVSDTPVQDADDL